MHSTAVDHFEGAIIPVRHNDSKTNYILEVRVFDNGVGFRYILPGSVSRKVSGEASAFVLPDRLGYAAISLHAIMAA